MQEAGFARVGLDLAAEAGDLDVDGAFASFVHLEGFDDFLAREDLAGLAGESLEQCGFAAGEMDDAFGAAQLGAGHVEFEGAEADGTGGFRGGGRGTAAKHGAEAEDEFVGLEGLGEIIIRAGFEAGDAVFGGAAGGEKEDGHVGALGAEGVGEGEAGFAGHHDVEHEQVGLDDAQLVPGFGGMAGGGDAEALFGEIAREEGAEADVIVHDEDESVVAHGFGGSWRCVAARSSITRACSSMMPRMTRRKPSTAGAPASR